MRIGILHNAYRYRGGEERVADAEATLLADHGVDVVRLTFDNRVAFTGLGPALRNYVNAAGGWNRDIAARIQDWIRRERLDLVHVHNLFPLITAAGPEAVHALRVPVVATLHNFRLLCASGSFTRNGASCRKCVTNGPHAAVVHGCYRGSRLQSAAWALGQRRAQSRETWRQAIARFIAPSEHVRDTFVDAGFDPNQFVVRPHFTDLPPMRPVSPGGALVIGRVDEAKGVTELVRRWPIDAPTLSVAGVGPDLETLRSEAGDNVRFLGQLDRSALARAIAGAGVVVGPSRLPETFGLTLIEAAACRTPVVSFDNGGARSIVQPDITGLLVTSGAMNELIGGALELLRDEPRRQRLGDAAFAQYRRCYSPQAGVESLIEIYDAALRPGQDIAA